MMRPVTLLIAVVVASLSAWGCASIKPHQQLSPEKAAEVRRMIVAWLECEECEEQQLEKVVALGTVAVPTLAATLKQGPSTASRELFRRHLADTYEQLVVYASKHPQDKLPMSREQYIKTYMENYVALYRMRAARALGAIGNPAARRALEDALKLSLRDDERNAVESSLRQIR